MGIGYDLKNFQRALFLVGKNFNIYACLLHLKGGKPEGLFYDVEWMCVINAKDCKEMLEHFVLGLRK